MYRGTLERNKGDREVISLIEIIAYSDGSFEGDIAASASLILTENEFLGKVVERHKVRTPYDAELLGVIQVLEFIEQNKIQYDKLTIYTDARAVVDKFPILKHTGVVPTSFKAHKKWKRILEMTKGKPVYIYHQQAHQSEHNPNKTCDILARIKRECTTGLGV